VPALFLRYSTIRGRLTVALKNCVNTKIINDKEAASTTSSVIRLRVCSPVECKGDSANITSAFTPSLTKMARTASSTLLQPTVSKRVCSRSSENCTYTFEVDINSPCFVIGNSQKFDQTETQHPCILPLFVISYHEPEIREAVRILRHRVRRVDKPLIIHLFGSLETLNGI
jgi:hypothetical protein